MKKTQTVMAGWCSTWFNVVELQAGRVQQAGGLRSRELELLQFVSALHYFRVAVLAVFKGDLGAVAPLDRVVPDLKDMRDMVCHFDEYSVGKGRRQKEVREAGEDPVWLTMLTGAGDDHAVEFIVNDKERNFTSMRLDVSGAAGSAKRVMEDVQLEIKRMERIE